MIRSTSESQTEILKSIQTLYCPEFECDITFGNGGFWKELPRPKICFDLDPQVEGVIKADSQNLPLLDNSISNLVFDPPFLTYIRGREHNSIMGKRFSGYWSYDELETYYRNTLAESYRVLKPKGIMVFKCQDIVHNHKFHCTHAKILEWGKFQLKDMFILLAKNRMPIKAAPHGKQTQRHARIFHSYFLVLQK